MKYKLIEKEGENFYRVLITEGEFRDVEYSYGKLTIKEPTTENEMCVISFTREIYENPNGLDLFNNSKFNSLIGNILQDIIEKNV